MERNFVYISETKNAYENMAADEWFLDHVGQEDLILHFYQNENAVIIGKGQNPWVECDLDAMEKDGVQLARRVSGGGAVYHDEGNVNFSFICGEKRYDRHRLLSLIAAAVRELGIDCEFSGRNDLLAEGKKFSGNAVADRKGAKLCHGTLLISSDLDRLARYLTVDPKKIRAKGISSVRSRVCNLTELAPDLTLRQMQNAILKQLVEWGGFYGEFAFSNPEKEELAAYVARHSDPAWRLGQTPAFDVEFRERLPWGSVQLCFSVEKGIITAVKAYSDAMDATLCPGMEEALAGVFCKNEEIQNAFRRSPIPELQLLSEYSFL